MCGFQGPTEGPGAPPGAYAVRLTLDGKSWTQKFAVKADPRTAFTQAKNRAQKRADAKADDKPTDPDAKKPPQ